jgi:hypothetical protein
MNNWDYKKWGFPKNHGEPAHGQGKKKATKEEGKKK